MEREKYRNVLEHLKENTPLNYPMKNIKNYQIKGNKLMWKRKNGKLVKVIKEDEKDSILFMVHNHETGGHFGIENTHNKLAERFYWEDMYKDIKQYIKYCDACQRRGKKGGNSLLYPIKLGEPFERIGIDFVGPLPKTSNGNKYILVVTDYLTKWPEAQAMEEANAENTADYLYKQIICRHGCPKIIISDRGMHFKNKLMEELCEKFKIKHKFSSPYHPQTNGLVERFNRTLCEALAKVSAQEKYWDRYIEQILFAYRTNRHSTTKKTPFYLMYGREATLPIDDLECPEKTDDDRDLLKRIYDVIELNTQRDEILEKITKLQEKQKERHDKDHVETTLKIGDKVLLKDSKKDKQWTGKLTSNWKGPYYVHDIIGKGAYKIRTLDGKVLKASQNIKNLKKYFDPKKKEIKIYL